MRWKPKVKICCISCVEEARMAIDHGASAIGLVSEMPSGPGVISEDLRNDDMAKKVPDAIQDASWSRPAYQLPLK